MQWKEKEWQANILAKTYPYLTWHSTVQIVYSDEQPGTQEHNFAHYSKVQRVYSHEQSGTQIPHTAELFTTRHCEYSTTE